MDIKGVAVKSIAGIIVPIALDALEKGYPPETVCAKCFDTCTKLGEEVNDQLHDALGDSAGENVESTLQQYLDAAIDGAQAGFNNGLDLNEVPSDDDVE